MCFKYTNKFESSLQIHPAHTSAPCGVRGVVPRQPASAHPVAGTVNILPKLHAPRPLWFCPEFQLPVSAPLCLRAGPRPMGKASCQPGNPKIPKK